MTGLRIPLQFHGYWPDVNECWVPRISGVYAVYGCTFNPWRNTVALGQLIYIGESDDVRRRIWSHERKKDWYSFLGYTCRQIAYSVAPIAEPFRVRAEAALIRWHMPPANVEYKFRFPYDTTQVLVSGDAWGLSSEFSVRGQTLAEMYAAAAQLPSYTMTPLATALSGYGYLPLK
jgi:hypothetical protein